MTAASLTITAGSAASVLFTPGGTASAPTTVAIMPASDILIGGPDTQTFTVTSAGISLDLRAGDVIYVKRAGGADVSVSVLVLGY